ncbi:hypothetical protein G7Y89_g7798 [Cudoniella acicularis]|uniref:Uncharacterized protein n=1 Tax=Cudoniella acicularis TaxID=354080 RepID=A0A8H4RHR1_9HELO|nr:hypothetical protein G7Y89_g7798 [Cudoniella acicularis]
MQVTMGGILTQLFPPSPKFTDNNLPSLVGKVFIVTSANSGVGFEVAKILYCKGGTVYIAGRSPTKVAAAIEAIRTTSNEGPGYIKSLYLDLSDLSTISTCVSSFLAQETRLDVLWNNAGIGQSPAGSVSVQGHEAHMGTNCLGPFLLTKLLLPIFVQTAKSSPRGSVRVIFTSSGLVDMKAPEGGVSLTELAPDNLSKDVVRNYSASKAGNWFLASEFDKRIRKEGIVCVTQNPGNLRTSGWTSDRIPWAARKFFSPVLHEPKFGAYTELWVGLSEDVKCEDGGRFAIPWGRWHPSPRADIIQSLKTKEEGGTGLAAEFWGWCEERTKEFAGNRSAGQ